MLCTDCRRPVKPVVAMDIDGTLGGYHSHFIRFAEGWLGRNEARPMSYDGTTSLAEFLGIDKQTYRQIKLAYRQGGMKRTMPTYQGAVGMVNTLRSVGAEVWLTTTRPYLRLDNVDPDTRWWLELHRFQYDGLLYDEHKYQVLMDIVGKERIVGILDDDPEMFDEAETLGLPVWLIRRQHNQHVQVPRLAPNLDAASDIFRCNIEEWKNSVKG